MEFVSAGIEKLTGYPPSAFTARSPFTRSPALSVPSDRQEVAHQIEAALASQRAFQVTYRIITASGATKWVWEQGAAVLDAKRRGRRPRRLYRRYHAGQEIRRPRAGTGGPARQGARCHFRDGHELEDHLLEQGRAASVRLGGRGSACPAQKYSDLVQYRPARVPPCLRRHRGEWRVDRRMRSMRVRWRRSRNGGALVAGAGRRKRRHAAKRSWRSAPISANARAPNPRSTAWRFSTP